MAQTQGFNAVNDFKTLRIDKQYSRVGEDLDAE
jgi:hypothetical protein